MLQEGSSHSIGKLENNMVDSVSRIRGVDYKKLLLGSEMLNLALIQKCFRKYSREATWPMNEKCYDILMELVFAIGICRFHLLNDLICRRLTPSD